MSNRVVSCFSLDEYLGKTDAPASHMGTVTVEWLLNQSAAGTLITGAREYQREKVAPIVWKQDLMKTLLCDPYARIPQIHIRVIKIESVGEPTIYKFELVDGQQRVTAILDYIAGQYTLHGKESKDLETAEKKLIGSFDIDKLRTFAPSVYSKLMNYEITALWYENLTEQQVSDLFVNVLNNQNDLNDQEKRNAMRGLLTEFVRNLCRPLSTQKTHELFERIKFNNKKGKGEEELKFLRKLKLKGRMEADEWYLQLIYMCEHGMSGGITSQKALTDWVRRSQMATGFAHIGNSEFTTYRKRWMKLTDWTLEIIKSVPKDNLSRLTPMVAHVLALYAWEVEQASDNRLKIKDKKKFTSMFFEVMTKWNDIKVYGDWKQINGKDMQPFKDLFGGKNPNAMQTIRWILNRERGIDESKTFNNELLQGPFCDLAKKEYSKWGIVELDSRETFSKQDIYKKWKEQDKKCFYTGRLIDEDDLAGDHYIPRSYGIEAGGVTEYHNLRVTDRKTNLAKLNIHGDDFIRRGLQGAS